jgi:hypothetical protein
MAAAKTITKKTAAGFEKMLSEVGVLSVEQLAKLSAAAAVYLQEKLESGEKPIPAKKAAKKVAAAAASAENSEEEAEEAAPKVQSPHLQFNRELVAYIRAYSIAHGWEVSFQKKVTPRGGESYMQEMPSSIHTAAGHVFPNTGKPMSPSDAMALAKHYKESNHEIWQAYVAEHPLPVTVPKAKKMIPVKTVAAAVTVVPVAVVPRKLPVVAAPAAAAAPVAPLRIVAKSKVKAVVKPVEPEWVCPEGGEGEWMMDGQSYIRDADDLVWTLKVNDDGDAERDVWCGKWDKVTKLFDKTVADPRESLGDDE